MPGIWCPAYDGALCRRAGQQEFCFVAAGGIENIQKPQWRKTRFSCDGQRAKSAIAYDDWSICLQSRNSACAGICFEDVMFGQPTQIRRHIVSCCALAVLCCALTGCFLGKKTVIQPDARQGRSESRPVAVKQFSVQDAEAAWNAGEAARAEQAANRVVAQPNLPRNEAARAYRVLALSALANNHPYVAMTSLERWLAADAAAEESSEWQATYLGVLPHLPPYDASGRASRMMSDTARPFPLQSGSALFLASRQWEKSAQAPQALANLQAFYAQAPNRAARGHMEHALLALLKNADSVSLETLDTLVTDENSKAYPHAVIRLETFRRLALSSATRAEAQEGVAQLAEGSAVADPGIFAAWDVPAAAATITPLAGKNIVLALPFSGSLSGIGKKIAAGAEAARSEFASAGHRVGLVLLDTQSPEWMDKLAALPAGAAVVGGPLRLNDFVAAHNRGLTQTRVFFAFTPSIGDANEEGRIGWRFFPSRDDQIAALLPVARKLDVTRFAVVMPEGDSYSTGMAEMFAAQVGANGGEVVRRLEYPLKEPEQWNKLVGSFLGTHKKASRAPATPFQAVFLPDSWRNMELIVPNFFYFKETRQLLLGTALWEQGLTAAKHVTPHYYRLAVFPGAWNKTTPSHAGMQLQAAYARAGKDEPDFWAGLGYDFVRHASVLDVGAGWTAHSVNAALSRNTPMEWSMAPLSWNAQGRAQQKLFLFTPTAEGFEPANLPAIEAEFNRAWRR